MTTAHTATPKQVYAHRHGILGLKPDRCARVIECGGIVLEFGDQIPENGILLADCRPIKFTGRRNSDDPADTAIFIGYATRENYVTRRQNFEHALRKAIALAKASAA